MSEDDNYKVGYGRPPEASRWSKGQSGNRRGRLKGTRNLKTELTEELREIVHIKERGVARRITKQRALVKALTAKAVQGDTRAATILINIIFRLLRPELIESVPPELTTEDQAILDTFEVRRRTDDEESGQ